MRGVELGVKTKNKTKDSNKKEAYQKQKGDTKKLKQLKNKLGKIEKQIENCEKVLAEKDAELATDLTSSDSSFFENYQKLRRI